MSNINSQKWKKPEYTKKQIRKAGKIIKDVNSIEVDKNNALLIIDNWRAAHAYPLHIIYMYFRPNSNGNYIVAQRLKRLDSITKKLQRFPEMDLWRMQDLGGCRIIANSNEDVYKIAEKYDNSRKRHILKRCNDYIENPQNSGYRSLHHIYEYRSDNKDSPYNKNMLIEVQFRTKLQHLWATAVETMGIFTHQALKSGAGNTDIKRFFVLISSLFAIEEGKPIVPNTINDIDELIHEIEAIDAKCNFLDMLSAIKVAIKNQEDILKIRNSGFFILILNYNTHLLNIKYFKPFQIESANMIYDKIEKSKSETKIDAVLVRVESIKDLKNAYPNYFFDINEFITKVKSYLI